jgi:RNA polymerase sigma-70 factor (ECF subfamily)
LADYYLLHSARAEMYRWYGRTAEARSSYEKALALTQQEPERQFFAGADFATEMKRQSCVMIY